MSPLVKTRRRELTEQLRQSISGDANAVLELVKLVLEDAKQSLVNATGDDMLRKQGEAQAFERLYRALTIAPPQQENN